MKYQYTLLIFIYILQSILNSISLDQVIQFPRFGSHSFKIFSGYLRTQFKIVNDVIIEDGEQKVVQREETISQMHYIFVESQQNPQSSPLIIQINNERGCSSIETFLKENGPYIMEDIDGIFKENFLYSLNREANVLYLDGPPGVGFSKTTQSSPYTEDYSSEQFLNALITFADNFDNSYNIYSNKIWIAGENYAAIFIPHLVNKIIAKNNQLSSAGKPNFRLSGFIIGNGAITPNDEQIAKHIINVFIKNKFFNTEYVNYYNNDCIKNGDEAKCNLFVTKLQNIIKNIDPYSIFSYTHTYSYQQNTNTINYLDVSSINGRSGSQMSLRLLELVNRIVKMRIKQFNSSQNNLELLIQNYLNQSDIKVAIHVDSSIQWQLCRQHIYDNYAKPSFSKDLYTNLESKNLKILFYGGNTNSIIPLEYMEQEVNDIIKNKVNMKTLQSWRQWKKHVNNNNQVGGFIKYWKQKTNSNFQIAYAVIRGGGLQQNSHQKELKHYMISNFVKEIDI